MTSAPGDRVGRWLQVLAGWVMAASAVLFALIALGLLVAMAVGAFRAARGGPHVAWAILIPAAICALLALAGFLMARRLLRPAPVPAGPAPESAGRTTAKRPMYSNVVVFSALCCAACGVWIGSAGGAFSIAAHPAGAVVGGLVGLLLGLILYVDDRSVQRRLKERAQGEARHPEMTPQPPEAARPPSESVAFVMLVIPVVAGVLMWQGEFFHLTARAAALLLFASVLSTAVLGYVDARQLLLRSPATLASSGPPSSRPRLKFGTPIGDPLSTFEIILFLWLLAYPAHFVARRRAGARDFILPALAATVVFLAPTFRAVFFDAGFPSAGSPAAEAHFERGFACAMKGDYDRAIADYTQAIHLNPRYAAAYNNRGNACLQKGDSDKAIADCSKAIELDPQLAEACYNRGLAYIVKGDYDKAIADYTQAIRLDPAMFATYSLRGDAYGAKGDHDKAIADYSKAIELNPRDARAYKSRAFAFYRKGGYDKAIADLTRAIELNPQDAEAYASRGAAYGEKGDLDKAIADDTVTIRLKPTLPTAFRNRGRDYHSRGDHDRAIADFTEAIRLDPGNADGYGLRGKDYSATGDYDKAWADVKKCRELGGTPDPKFIEELTRASGRNE